MLRQSTFSTTNMKAFTIATVFSCEYTPAFVSPTPNINQSRSQSTPYHLSTQLEPRMSAMGQEYSS